MATALVATGCGTAVHLAALAAAKTWAGSHGYATDTVRCTNGISVPYRVRKNDFLCIVHRSSVLCDEIRLDQSAGRWHVAPYRRKVDCVLPA